jgi:L-malate glycosyltransferase
MGQSAAICFVIATTDGFPPQPGGLAVAAGRICRHLTYAGFEVHVVTAAAEGSTVNSVTRQDGLTVHRLGEEERFIPGLFKYQHYLRRLDSEVHFDLFHAFFLPSLPPCMAVARTASTDTHRPVIASIRGSDAMRYVPSPYYRPMMIAAMSNTNCWVTSVNQAYLDYVAQSVDISGRSSVMRNGAPPLRRLWRLTGENFGVIGCCGQYRKVKDIPLLVRAYRRVNPALRRRLLLIGEFVDPVEESWSRTLLEESGVANELELTSLLPHHEAMAQLARLHVYVQSSAFEGMPNALLEAAATGVPIVATAVGGVKEVFTHGHDAMLVPHADPVAMARAIEQVLGNEDLAHRLADNAAQLCARFSRERERDEWIALHHDLIAAAVEKRAAHAGGTIAP